MSVQVKGSGTIGGLDEGLVVSGIVTSSTQINVGSNIKLGSAGVVTATSFVGSGANLTSLPSQLTLSNNADNRVITGGSGTNLNGEANLTYNGSNLALTGNDNQYITIGASADLTLKADGSNSAIVHNGDGDLAILAQGTDENIKLQSAGYLHFLTGGGNERLRIDSSGRIGIGENNPTRDVVLKTSGSVQFSMVGATNQSVYLNFGDTDDDNIGAVYYDNPNDRMIIRANTNNAVQVKSNGNMAINDGDLEIGTAGHGISFAATGQGGSSSSMQNELLDDYEEGVWVPVANGFTASGTYHANYTKIGRLVHITMWVQTASGSSGSPFYISGLPYTVRGGTNCYQYACGRLGSGGHTNSASDIVFEFTPNNTTIFPKVQDGGMNWGMASNTHVMVTGSYISD